MYRTHVERRGAGSLDWPLVITQGQTAAIMLATIVPFHVGRIYNLGDEKGNGLEATDPNNNSVPIDLVRYTGGF